MPEVPRLSESQIEAMDLFHLAGIGDHPFRGTRPDHHRRDHETGAGGVVIQATEHILLGDLHTHLLTHLPQRGLLRGFTGIQPPARQRPLTWMVG